MRIPVSWLPWLFLIVLVIVAVVVVLAIVGAVLGARRKRAGLEVDPSFPVDGPEARDLAVGLLTITDNAGRWNDPDGRIIASSKGLASSLRKQWGVDSPADWRENIERLMVDRRRSEPRDTLLAIRWEWAQQHRRHPYYRDWLAAVKAQGGSTKGENRDLIVAMTNIDDRLEKFGHGAVMPKSTTVRDVYAFAYSQAVALAVWGVAMGVATRAEALEVARQVSERARSEYGSWQEFGRSVLLGRAMFLGRGTYNKDRFTKTMDKALTSYVLATNPRSRRPGPWTYLAW